MRSIVVALQACSRIDPAKDFVLVSVRVVDYPDHTALVPVPTTLGQKLKLGDSLDINVDPVQGE